MAKTRVPLDQSTWLLIRRLLREGVRPHAGRIGMALACMAVVAAATAASAWLMDPVVNKVFVERDMALLWPVGGAVLLTFLVKGLASYGQAALLAQVGQRSIAGMQCRLFEHLLGLDLAFFHGTATGGLVSRLTVDVNMMRGAVSNALTSFGKDTLSVIFLVALMFYQDWMLAAVSFIAFPIAILPIVRLGRRMRRASTDTQEEIARFTTILEQSFQGMRVIKSYAMEARESGKVREVVEAIYSHV
ncbi:MAG: ABC transporter permease, partial [Alphaproteobacteria bacterium]|nr:ABC transporter permease [Alphaproteobacteria bacterium]